MSFNNFQFPLLGSLFRFRLHYKNSVRLSIPFVGFKNKKEKRRIEKIKTFNSLCWVPECGYQGYADKRKAFNSLCWVPYIRYTFQSSIVVYFQFPLLGSVIHAFLDWFNNCHCFQFPLLGSSRRTKKKRGREKAFNSLCWVHGGGLMSKRKERQKPFNSLCWVHMLMEH